jgi:hypothetical protein
VGCAVDLVKTGMNGYIFTSNEVEDLTAKLQLCSSKTKEELAAMGRFSKQIIADWSFENTCRSITGAL